MEQHFRTISFDHQIDPLLYFGRSAVGSKKRPNQLLIHVSRNLKDTGRALFMTHVKLGSAVTLRYLPKG